MNSVSNHFQFRCALTEFLHMNHNVLHWTTGRPPAQILFEWMGERAITTTEGLVAPRLLHYWPNGASKCMFSTTKSSVGQSITWMWLVVVSREEHILTVYKEGWKHIAIGSYRCAPDDYTNSRAVRGTRILTVWISHWCHSTLGRNWKMTLLAGRDWGKEFSVPKKNHHRKYSQNNHWRHYCSTRPCIKVTNQPTESCTSWLIKTQSRSNAHATGTTQE